MIQLAVFESIGLQNVLKFQTLVAPLKGLKLQTPARLSEEVV